MMMKLQPAFGAQFLIQVPMRTRKRETLQLRKNIETNLAPVRKGISLGFKKTLGQGHDEQARAFHDNIQASLRSVTPTVLKKRNKQIPGSVIGIRTNESLPLGADTLNHVVQNSLFKQQLSGSPETIHVPHRFHPLARFIFKREIQKGQAEALKAFQQKPQRVEYSLSEFSDRELLNIFKEHLTPQALGTVSLHSVVPTQRTGLHSSYVSLDALSDPAKDTMTKALRQAQQKLDKAIKAKSH